MTETAADDAVAGRTALITGGGSGLGRAIALALAGAGANVVLVGRTRASLEAVGSEVERSGVSARIAVCDTSSPEEVDQLRREFQDVFVSVLVNNAGVPGPVRPLVEVEPREWDAVFAVNVRGPYLMCRAFLPEMVARSYGDVVNLASVTGKRPLAGRTPYAASKLAVLGLTITLAHEVGRYGVRCNSLSPGPVRGPRMERNFKMEAERSGRTREEVEAEFVSRAALRRMLEEDEIGGAVVALLRLKGVTGADIDLSGGMIAAV